jgi:hypothetical protein
LPLLIGPLIGDVTCHLFIDICPSDIPWASFRQHHSPPLHRLALDRRWCPSGHGGYGHISIHPTSANIAKGDQSAESFEKTLSALAAKIAKTSAQSERLRKSARRLTVSWTLYGGFAYISALLIFTLVTGWRSWGATEYSVVSGGPVMSVIRPRDEFADACLDGTEFAVPCPPSTTTEYQRAKHIWTVYIKKRTQQLKG